MQIKQRALAGIALAIASIAVACVLWLWQQHEQMQHASRHAWQKQLAFAWQHQSERVLTELTSALAHPKKNISSSASEVESFSGSLTNATTHRLLSTAGDERLPIPASVLQGWIESARPLRGFVASNGQHFHWMVLSTHGDQWQLAIQPVTGVMSRLQDNLGGNFALLSPWQASLSCTAVAVGAQPSRCSRTEEYIALPIYDVQQHQIAELMWRPLGLQTHMQQLQQQFQRNVWMVAIAGVALLAMIVGILSLQLQPLNRGIAALKRLTQGEVHSHIDETHIDAEDEQGEIFQALHALRHELVQLETLRQERQRLRVQHERLIRNELRKLADSLDSASREEILQTLEQKNQPAPHDNPQQENTLAELAGVLGRMSGLVSTQQNRLLKLLKELQASMQTQAMLASLQQELEIARQMQLSILPRSTPPTPNAHIDALMLPAKEVGGDFYDYFLIDDDHLAVVVADVSGKGVPAAFFMAISRTLLKSNAMHLPNVSQTIRTLNDQLCAENDQMMFVTVFYAVLELSTGKLRYVNAGHNPPLLKQANCTTYLKSEKNMALAVLEEQEFAAGELTLQPGDSIIFYTDGVTEATDTSQALFGEAQLLDAVIQHSSTAQALPDYLLARIRSFEKGAAQADDITIVALQYLGRAPDAHAVST